MGRFSAARLGRFAGVAGSLRLLGFSAGFFVFHGSVDAARGGTANPESNELPEFLGLFHNGVLLRVFSRGVVVDPPLMSLAMGDNCCLACASSEGTHAKSNSRTARNRRWKPLWNGWRDAGTGSGWRVPHSGKIRRWKVPGVCNFQGTHSAGS